MLFILLLSLNYSLSFFDLLLPLNYFRLLVLKVLEISEIFEPPQLTIAV